MAFTIDRRGPGSVRLIMGSDFLADDAWQVHELIDRTDSGTSVELDFRRVRDCADFALSLLSRDILNGRVRIELLGMTQHQERVLSYFGVSASPQEAGDFDPI